MEMFGAAKFWAGKFGFNYRDRVLANKDAIIESNKKLFGKILAKVEPCGSILELGAGSGLNVPAVRTYMPEIVYRAIEVNERACADLREIPNVIVHEASVHDCIVTEPVDIVLTKGFLIHVLPHELNRTYDFIYRSARRYIVMVEYYNHKPEMVPYRFHKSRLWRRDFCQEIKGLYPKLNLLDYGFLYGQDEVDGQGEDLHWFLLEKGV